jgi:predicted nucleic acid-binding protein
MPLEVTDIPVDQAVSDAAVDLLRSYRLIHGLLIADSLIAATEIVENCPLITIN